jgi:Ca2+-binding RTX toxin-like protein
MATVIFTNAYHTDDFWTERAEPTVTATSTTYEFVNASGFSVRVTGTGFTFDLNDDPDGGNYTSITVFSDTGFATQLASYSSATDIDFATYFTSGGLTALAGADTITGSSGNDTLRGYGGADALDGGGGDDAYTFLSGDVPSGEVISDTGGSGTDTLQLFGSTDFTAATTIAGIEALFIVGAHTATFNASQFGVGLIDTDLAVSGIDGNTQTVAILGALSFSAAAWTFASWEATDVISITGTAAADSITGSSQNDTITGGGGTDTLNGGDGSDVYRYANGDVVGNDSVNDTGLTSDTDVIELIGNATVIDFSSASVLNIEALRFTDVQTAQFDQAQLPGNLAVTGAAATGQAIIVEMTSGAFSAGGWSFIDWGTNDKVNIVGRVSGDTITGSNQEDIITGLGGADSINGGDSADTYQYGSTSEASGDSINDSGTNGVDRLFLFGDVNFTGASIANVEGVAFDGANTATFNAGQFGGGLLSTSFQVTGAGVTLQTIVVQNASNFSAANWNFSNWESVNVPTLDTLSIIGTNGGDTLTGSNAHDIISGGLGADVLRGGGGIDTLDGGEGSDIYDYGAFSDVIGGETITDTGTAGKDTIRLLGDVSFLPIAALTGIEAFVFTGDQDFQINSFPIFGVDFELTGSNGTAQSFTVSNANDFSVAGWTLKNWENSDTIILDGGGFGGIMIGSSKRDVINAFGGEDTLTGGLGKDTLSGGTEADIFDFNSAKESTKGVNRDVITDFSGVNALAPDLDQIDLTTIDAKTTKGGNQVFKFIGAQKFHHKAGELHVLNKGAFFLVEGDRNGDGKADFQIQVVSEAALAKDDFVL